MCKKSFWLSLNPRIPPVRRTPCPAPRCGVPCPPRRLCTRRPFSSGATGESGGPEPGRMPCRRQRQTRRPGSYTWRRSPFSSVSSSSSSFLLLRFPAVVPVARLLRGSCSGAAFSGPSSNGPSFRFKSVEILFNLELSPKCRPRGGVRSVRRSSPVRLRPALPGSAPSSGSVRTTGFPPSVFPVYHPGPASCSARLLFVWFMVCIPFRFVFSSVRLSRFRSHRPILFVSACSGSFFRLVCAVSF